MLQFSKKVEYGLIALRHMAVQPYGCVFTAKEIAESYDIPFDLLAKVLQKLSKAGILSSMQGMRGGYSLFRKPDEIAIADVIDVIEDEKPSITNCAGSQVSSCSCYERCSIREPMEKVQRSITDVLEKIMLSEII
jgi:Rrf2 family protein